MAGGHIVRIHFATLDWAILGAYVAFLLIVGFWKRNQTTEEYVIADRGLGLPIFVATLVATWYGGILGVGEYLYESGLFEWTTNGLPYYVFAIVFAFVLARKVRGGAVNLYTIPDKLAQTYDRKTALFGASLAFIYASPSGAVLMLGVLLQALLGDDPGRFVFGRLCLSRRLPLGCASEHAAVSAHVRRFYRGVAALSPQIRWFALSRRAGTIAGWSFESAGRGRYLGGGGMVFYRDEHADRSRFPSALLCGEISEGRLFRHIDCRFVLDAL
jgi:hypothetical protein